MEGLFRAETRGFRRLSYAKSGGITWNAKKVIRRGLARNLRLSFEAAKSRMKTPSSEQCFEARQKSRDFGWVAHIKMSKSAARPANFHGDLIIQSGECGFVRDVVAHIYCQGIFG